MEKIRRNKVKILIRYSSPLHVHIETVVHCTLMYNMLQSMNKKSLFSLVNCINSKQMLYVLLHMIVMMHNITVVTSSTFTAMH